MVTFEICKNAIKIGMEEQTPPSQSDEFKLSNAELAELN
jgi:hypothetical protein